MSGNVPAFNPAYIKAPKIKRVKVSLAFRTDVHVVEIVHGLCEEDQRPRGEMLDILVREALVARGKLSSQG